MNSTGPADRNAMMGIAETGARISRRTFVTMLTAAAGTAGSVRAVAAPDALVWDIASGPQYVDPVMGTSAQASVLVVQNVYERLVWYDGANMEPIPWLATGWEITDGGQRYVFKLRKGIKFQDGSAFDANAVKFSFDRAVLLDDPIGIGSFFPTGTAAPGIFKGAWEFSKSFGVGKDYSQAAVDKYLAAGAVKVIDKGLPYLDGIEFYHVLPFSPEMGSAILSGRVDYVRITDPVTMRKAQSTPGLSTANYNQSVIHATWVNTKKKPFDDPRVRRAMHLALDRPVLAEVVKDVAPMSPGSFIYPFSEFATPKEEFEKRLGYQPDPAASIKEARSLLAATGFPNGINGLDYMVRDIAIFKLWSQAIQAMLKEALNIQCNLRTVVESVWFDDAASGHFDLAIGAVVGSLLDPSDSFSAWYGKDGPQNYSFWDNKDFQALSARIDREVDPAKRLPLVRQAEAIMEQDPPLLPIAWERINEVWYNYVKGLNPAAHFGIFDVVRLDTVWLDKA